MYINRSFLLIGPLALLSCQAQFEKRLNIIYEAVPETLAILKCLKHELKQSYANESINLIPFNLTTIGMTNDQLLEIGDTLWNDLRPGCELAVADKLQSSVPELHDFREDEIQTNVLSVMEESIKSSPNGSHLHLIAYHVPERRSEPTIYRLLDQKHVTLSLYVPVHTDIQHSRIPAWSKRLVYLGIEPNLVINPLESSGKGIHEAIRQAEDNTERIVIAEAARSDRSRLSAENTYVSTAVEFIVDTRRDANIVRIIHEVLRRIDTAYASYKFPLYYEIVFTGDGCWQDLSSWMTHRLDPIESADAQDLRSRADTPLRGDEYSVEYRMMRGMDASLWMFEGADSFSQCMDRMLTNSTIANRWKKSPADRNLQVYILTDYHGSFGAYSQEYLMKHPAWMPTLPHDNMVQYGILAATRTNVGTTVSSADSRVSVMSPCVYDRDCAGDAEKVKESEIVERFGGAYGRDEKGSQNAVEIAAFLRTFMHGVYPAEFRAAPFMYFVEVSRQLEDMMEEMCTGYSRAWRATWEEDLGVKFVKLSVVVTADNEDVANGGSCLMISVNRNKVDPDVLMTLMFGDDLSASGASLEAMYKQQPALEEALAQYRCNYKYMREYLEEYVVFEKESDFFNWNYDVDFSKIVRTPESRARGVQNWKRLLAALESSYTLADGLVVFLTDEAPLFEDVESTVSDRVLKLLEWKDLKLIISTPLFDTKEKIGTPHRRYQWAQFLHQVGLNGGLIASSFLPSGHRIWADTVGHWKTIVDVTPQVEGAADPAGLIKALEACSSLKSMELISVLQEGAAFGPYGQHLLAALSTILFTVERLGVAKVSALIQHAQNETYSGQLLVPQYAPTALGFAQRSYFWPGMRNLYRHWNYFTTRDDHADNDLYESLVLKSMFSGVESKLWKSLPSSTLTEHIEKNAANHTFLFAPIFAAADPNLSQWSSLPNTSVELLVPQVSYNDLFAMDVYVKSLTDHQVPKGMFYVKQLISNFAQLAQALEEHITQICTSS